MVEILYHTLVGDGARLSSSIGNLVTMWDIGVPLSISWSRRSRRPAILLEEVAASIRMKVQDDTQLRDPLAEKSRSRSRNTTAGDCMTGCREAAN